jgi:elongation factor G
MLIEHILHNAGVTGRLGSIEEGNTVCDYLEDEISHHQSITMKLCHVEHDGTRIHMVDHPGYADFLGEVASSSPLVDGMVIVVDAATGVQVGTDNAWKYAERFSIPRAFFVNKLDRENTDFMTVYEGLKDTYGNQCVPLVVPVGQAGDLKSVVNIFTGDLAEIADEVEALKESVAEAVAETDDELLEHYLENGELSPEDLEKGLLAGIVSGKIIPVLAGSVEKDLGLNELLELIGHSFPDPLSRKVVVKNEQGEEEEVAVSVDGPFLGQVFRSVVDPFVGHLTFFRVLSGTLKADSEFYNVTRSKKERTGKIFMLNGKDQKQVPEVGPGCLAALTKLKVTHFGDTVAAPGSSLHLPEIVLPESMVKLAITPKSRSDEDKIGDALHRLAEEDPTFTHYRDPETHEHVIKGMGDLQLSLMLDRMKRKHNVEAETRTPKVAYLETIKGKSEVQGKHKKQSGGHGQYGDVHIRMSPNTRGEGYKFIDAIVGGVVPKQYIPHVDKGCQEALLRGVISGHPVVDITVELFFGSYHNVDSSEMAFKMAASKAVQKGIVDARPCILEPLMEIAVTVPEEYMGDINGDLSSRRGRISGMDALGGGRQCIRAIVPEAEVLRYSTDLRSITQGRGSYELKFVSYEEVPDHVSKEIVAAYEKEKAEAE